MGVVKSAFEKAMEKIKVIEELTPEEREDLKNREKLRSLLSAFYKGELTRNQVWERFKGIEPSFLKDAQQNMADSLRLGAVLEEFQKRKDGILAIEALKETQNVAVIESSLNAIDKLQREYRDMKERAIEEIRAAVKENPQLRVRPVRTPDGRTVLQAALSIEEAVKEKMAEFLAENEKRYEAIFEKALERLKRELK
ncbi:MAG TPA: hypothetical protein DCP92_20445 [Nitrospiraceae bacterium]|jgi:hypothetical protein|nr:hypothetical protein [Nitrospiraceae bacterium]